MAARRACRAGAIGVSAPSAPEAPADAAPPTPPLPRHHRPSRRRIAFQVTGFVVSLGILAWFLVQVFRDPARREQVAALLGASPAALGAVLALTGATVALNGLIFWAVFLPVRRLSAADAVAVNGVCTLLGYVPFKVSLLFRVWFHHARDRIPLLTIGAWLAAAAAVILASLAPALGATLWRRQVDPLWWATALGGAAGLAALIVVVARACDSALARSCAAAALRRGPAALRHAAHGHAGRNLSGGIHMLAAPRSVGLAMAIRAADIAVQAARFHVAAGLAGVDLNIEQAVIAGTAYFFLQATAPTGVAGVREGGTVAVVAALGLPDLTAVILAISAAEFMVATTMGTAGALWLRVWRLGRGA